VAAFLKLFAALVSEKNVIGSGTSIVFRGHDFIDLATNVAGRYQALERDLLHGGKNRGQVIVGEFTQELLHRAPARVC
jgi:hypothetical protein